MISFLNILSSVGIMFLAITLLALVVVIIPRNLTMNIKNGFAKFLVFSVSVIVGVSVWVYTIIWIIQKAFS